MPNPDAPSGKTEDAVSGAISLWQEIIFIIGAILFLAVLILVLTQIDPTLVFGKIPSGFSWAIAIAFGVAHAIWITMDLKRLKREQKVWRFFAILLGPFTISYYIMRTYDLRSFYLVPLYALILMAIFLPSFFVVGFTAGPSGEGYSMFETENYGDAIRNYTEIIAEEGGDGEVYYFRGLAYYEQRAFDAAIRDFTVALERQYDLPNSFYMRGASREMNSDVSGALKDYLRALEVASPNWEMRDEARNRIQELQREL